MMVHPFRLLAILLAPLLCGGVAVPTPEEKPVQRYVFTYFQGNGESGVYLALSEDGITFTGANDNQPILRAPDWPGENLTRDPSILFHDGVYHMVWTTSWTSRSIGYASSKDLVTWSEPKKIDLWGDRDGVRNTWAPEVAWDPGREAFFILWASTIEGYAAEDGDTTDIHGYDHRMYATRTKDFQTFSTPELFYTPKDPEHGVIDGFVAHDEENDRWVMVIKNEMAPDAGGKNLRLTFAKHAQGPYGTRLGEPIVGQGTPTMDRMAEGPCLLKADGLWRLYWDAPGSREPYCLATSPDLVEWTDRSAEVRMPVRHPRHGRIIRVPADAIGW